jgi:O-antigen chain-terminating methyltransferase
LSEQRLEDLVERLERERLAADRLYNDALTAVDRAIQTGPSLPAAPQPYDRSRLADLNASWDPLPAGPPFIDRSLKGRLRAFVWRLIGPPLEAQKRFNAALVDHLNRNVDAEQQVRPALDALLQTMRREFDALVRFESLLVQYLQTITVYVDSKDRSVGGAELRQRLALAEQRILGLKRDIEARTASAPQAHDVPAAGRNQDAFSGSVDSATYVEFEHQFRGSEREVRSRVEEYLPLLTSTADIVDIGCGRGELLDLLKERGIAARGVDVNQSMVALCRSRGLDVEQGDAVDYLRKQSDRRVGGLVAIQVVEHFEPSYLMRFLETAFHKMRPGAPLILETINPACWMAFFETYIRDLTHQRPLHPETLRYLVQACGFSNVAVQFRRPVEAGDRLQRVVSDANAQTAGALAAAINDHADKLNARLFSSMDYVVVARR